MSDQWMGEECGGAGHSKTLQEVGSVTTSLKESKRSR